MAFQTTRTNGTAQGTINATWYNDFMTALTGGMIDQPYTMVYTPGSSGSPTLTLQCNSNNHPFHVINGSGAQIFDLDNAGNITMDNELLWQKTLGGSNQNIFNVNPPDVGSVNYILTYNASNNHLFIWDGTDSRSVFDVDRNGNLTVPGTVTAPTFSGALSGNASTATNATNASNVPASGVGSGTLGTGVNASYAVGTGFTINAASTGLVLGHTSGAAAMTIASITTGVGIGFKLGGISGTKVGEIKSSGAYVSFGGFATTGASGTINTSGTFDTFDIAETYPVDQHYEPGDVLCLHGEVFSLCDHDNCHSASVVSAGGAFNIGGGEFSYDPTDEPIEKGPYDQEPLALAGRVLAKTSDPTIKARDLVCSDGKGGVRAVTPGGAWVIGYALHDAHEGVVGIFVKPTFAAIGE